jgi:hypothetical protein
MYHGRSWSRRAVGYPENKNISYHIFAGIRINSEIPEVGLHYDLQIYFKCTYLLSMIARVAFGLPK